MNSLKKTWELLSGGGNPDFESLGISTFIIILLVSLAYSFLCSWTYSYFYGKKTTGSQLQRAFPLLGVSITGIFICIQFSLPLSLGLLGALSIIRFRTPIKEPEEVGFLMFLISGSIACATFNLKFLAIFTVAGILCPMILAYCGFGKRSDGNSGTLILKLDTAGREAIKPILHVEKHLRLDAMNDSKDEVVLTYIFREMDEAATDALCAKIKSAAPQAAINLFFHRAENLV